MTPSPGSSRWVHPRGGLAAALLGLAVLGAGIALALWWLTAIGALVALSRVSVAVLGGVLYNARSRDLMGEVSEVEHGDDHEGVVPGLIHDPRAENLARGLDQQRRRIPAATVRTHRPPPAPLGEVLLLIVAAFLLGAQWTLYPFNQTEQDNALRDLGCGIAAALAGLRILVGRPGRHGVAVAGAVLSGLALLLAGLVATHSAPVITVVEAATGATVLMGALLCIFSGIAHSPLVDTRVQEEAVPA